MTYFGEQLPQENLKYAHEVLLRETESRMHPKEDHATLAICDGIVINITDENGSYRYDIHGVLPSSLKTGEGYRSVHVGKLSTLNHEGMLTTMSIAQKLTGSSAPVDIIIDEKGRPVHLEERYGAIWSVRDIQQPDAMTIYEINSMLQRSSSLFMPVDELQDIFTQQNRDNNRKWDAMTRDGYDTQSAQSRVQQLLSWLAMLRS